jgi:hypothetical protein
MARRDNREYRTYLRAEQRRQRGCIARRMQRHLHHGLLDAEFTRVGVNSSLSGPSLHPALQIALRALTIYCVHSYSPRRSTTDRTIPRRSGVDCLEEPP